MGSGIVDAALSTPHGPITTISNITGKSEALFETVLRLYYLRHSFMTYYPIMMQFLSVLGFATVGKFKDTPGFSPDGMQDQIAACCSQFRASTTKGWLPISRHCVLPGLQGAAEGGG
jgi:hypothetical protein